MEQSFSSKFANLTDMKDHVGEVLGISEWLNITQERIDTFAKATEDHQWIHTDPEIAKIHSPYGISV